MHGATREERGGGAVERGVLVRAVGEGAEATRELTRLLGIQARLGGASAGAVLRVVDGSSVDVLAVWPGAGPGEPGWLERAGAVALEVVERRATVVSGEGGARLVVVSLGVVGEDRGVTAFVVEGGDEGAVARLELGAAVIGLHSLRVGMGRLERRGGHLASAVEVAGELALETRYTAAAMALVNGLAARFDADRVSVGMVGSRRDGFVRVGAISHTERVVRKMRLVGAIESAMQESADQDVEVAVGCSWSNEAGVVEREALELSGMEGGAGVLSLPLRDGEGVVGALTIERRGGFDEEELAALRLVGNVAGPRLAELESRDRWFGARLASWARGGAARLVGPERTWAKVAVVALAVLVGVAVFGRGMEHASGAFVAEAEGKRVVSAPFEGFVRSVEAREGDVVIGGETVLAVMDDAELRVALAEVRARARALREREAASRGRGQIAEAQIAGSQAEEAEAGIGLLEHRLSRTRVVAPIDGVVLERPEGVVDGTPVETGRVLFEVAPAGSLRLVVWAPEDRVSDVAVGARGFAAPVAYPGRRIGFEVESISPMARVVEGQNVFRVECALDEAPGWLRPGMEGVARIELGEASLAWVWGRDVVEWVRMRLWW